MQDAGYAALQIVPSFKGLQGNLEKGTGTALTRAGISGGTKFGDSAGRSAGQRFGSVFKSAAKAGLVGLAALTVGALKIGNDALDEAVESQKVGRLTAAVIKSTGGAAKVSKKDVGDLAGRLSYMAGVDDELVQSGANVLLTFKNVRNEAGKGNKIFDRAAKVTLNMSKALGTDLKGASIQVGKALNDPVKGITALARAGVTFSTKQKAQIKALVEGGDANAAMALGLIDSTTTYNNLLKENGDNANKVAGILKRDLNPAQKEAFDHYAEGNHIIEAQKRELKELGSEFGGAARSQASASDRLKVAFGNVEESLGKGLLPMVQDFSRFLLRKGVPAAKDFTRWFKHEGVPGIKDLGKKLEPLANQLLPAAADAFDSIRSFAGKALPKVTGIVSALNDMPDWMKKVLVGGVVGGVVAKKFNLGSLFGSSKGGGSGLLGLVTKAKPLPVFVVNNGIGSGGLPGAVPGGGRIPTVPVGKLPKGAAFIPVGLGSAPGQESLIHKLTGIGPGGDGNGGKTPLTVADYQKMVDKKSAIDQKHLDDFSALLFRPLGKNAFVKAGDDTTAAFGRAKNKAGDLKLFVEHGIPKTVDVGFNLFGIDVAKQQINGMFDLFMARNTHVTQGFSGSDASTGTTNPPNHSRSRTTVSNTTVNQTINVHDLAAAEKRRLVAQQQASMGGYGGDR